MPLALLRCRSARFDEESLNQRVKIAIPLKIRVQGILILDLGVPKLLCPVNKTTHRNGITSFTLLEQLLWYGRHKLQIADLSAGMSGLMLFITFSS